jgi:cytochrome P450
MAPLSPPGPKFPEILRSASLWQKDPLAFLLNLQDKFGDVVTLGRFGRTPLIALFHPDGIQQVLQTNAEAYERGPANTKFAIIEGQGIFVAEGPQWLRQRRRLQPVFHSARLKSYGVHLERTAQSLCEHWRQYSDSRVALDVMPELLRYQFTVAGPMVLGCDLTQRAATIAQAVEIARDQVSYRTVTPLALPHWFPTKRNRRFNAAKRQLEGEIATLIAERRASEVGQDAKDDALSILLNATRADGSPLSPRELRDEIMTLFVAGHHPAAAAMTWALYLLATNLPAQEQMCEEVSRVLQSRPPEVRDLDALPFTRAVVQETLRLCPPVWAQSRQAHTADVIGGYHIPRGSRILMPQLVTHRHSAFWPSPHDFQPARFLAGAPHAPSSPHRFAYFPFGGGQRACLGSRLALLVLPLTLAAIVQSYEVRYAGDQPPRLEPGVTLLPKNGLRLLLQRREE